jgi:hypothetical protein
MTNIKATFSNGTTLTRNTDKPYTHAWIAQSGGSHNNVACGFTTSAEKAERTARTYFNRKEWKSSTWEVKAI